MTYRAPVADITFTLKHAAGFGAALSEGLYGELSEDVVEAVLAEAGRFATEVLAPLNTVGDKEGARIKDGVVTTPTGWKAAYRGWAEGGWNAVAAPPSKRTASSPRVPSAIRRAAGRRSSCPKPPCRVPPPSGSPV